MDYKETGTASREAKHMLLWKGIGKILREVNELEALIVEITGNKVPTEKSANEVERNPSLQEFLSGEIGRVNGISERIAKARAELREILL